MAIRAVAITDFAEFSVPRERSYQKLVLIVTAIFKEHERSFRPFVCVDELLHIAEVMRSANFYSNGDSLFHRGERDFHVRSPARADDNRVNFAR